MRSAAFRGVATVALALATAFAYAEVSEFPFLAYDDQVYVTQNSRVLGGLTVQGLEQVLTRSRRGNWHPLTSLSHMLDVELFGLDAGAHHLVNLALHAVNSVILFWVLSGLTGAPGRSAFVAGVFALHPLHVESVAWISERKDVLSTLFALLTIAAWGRFVRTRGVGAYLTACVLLVFGMLAKPMLVTLPAVLLLLDVWPLRRVASISLHGLRLPLVEKLPLFALAVVTSAIALATQSTGITHSLAFSTRAANALISYPRYLFGAFWPVDLAAFYPAVAEWPLAQVLGSALLVATISGLALWRLKREPYLAVGWFWFVGMLVPVTGWVPVGLHSLACRYMYMPLIGLSIAVAWGVHAAFVRARWRDPALAAVSIALLAVSFSLTRSQVSYWQDDRTLWEHTLAVTDDNWFAHTALGGVMIGEGDLDAAIAQIEIALRVWPYYARAHMRLGQALAHRNEFERALHHLDRALAFEPELAETRYWLGYVSERAGQLDDAVNHYRDELALSPEHIPSALRLAWLLAMDPDPNARRSEKTLAAALRACELTHYRNPVSVNVLALALAAADRFDEALTYGRLAMKLATDSGNLELAAAIEPWLRRYRAARRMGDARRDGRSPQRAEADGGPIQEQAAP